MTDMKTVTITLPPFPTPGSTPHDSYPSWNSTLLQTSETHGILWSMLNPERREQLTEAGITYIPQPPPPPGIEPPEAHHNQWANWNEKSKRYNTYYYTLRQMGHAMTMAMATEETKACLTADQTNDGLGRTPFQSKTLIDNAYARHTAEQLLALQKTITTVYVFRDRNFTAFVHQHKTIHAAFQRAEVPMSEHRKYELFMDTVKHVPEFHTSIEIFETAHPLHTRSFTALVAAIQTRSEGQCLDDANTGTIMGTANAATTQLEALQAKIAQLEANAKGPKRGTNKKPGYCHTHGMTFHTSATCKNPGPEHKAEATNQNKMGGETRKWTDVQRENREQKPNA